MKQTMTRRFYASCSAVEYAPLLGTFDEALKDAESKLRTEDSKACKLGEIYIVEVVKILRFKVEEKPIEVIEVRK